MPRVSDECSLIVSVGEVYLLGYVAPILAFPRWGRDKVLSDCERELRVWVNTSHEIMSLAMIGR